MRSRYYCFASTIACESNSAQECILRLTGIQPRVLHDDRNIARDYARKWRIGRDWFGIFEVVEAKVTAAPRCDLELIGTNWISGLVKKKDFDSAISSPALRMQIASWLIICGDGPWL